jgi:enamine deaminase RidA (YjgF/YER057c/UK114 family)
MLMLIVPSQAVQVDNTLYVSGMIGTDQNSKLVEGGIAAEAKTALTHLGNVLAAAGTSFENGTIITLSYSYYSKVV